MKASRISILRNQLFCTGSCRPANPTGCWFPDEVSPQGAWWCLCESGDHEDSQTAQGIYGTVWRNAERWKKSHNDRHLYDELISYADLYDSASFEAKKMIVNQLIRRVDVYRGYQINISFNFDLTPYIEGEWYVRLQNSRASNKYFQKQRNSKNWGLPSMHLQNQAFGWFSMQPLRKQKEKHRTSNEVQCFFGGE